MKKVGLVLVVWITNASAAGSLAQLGLEEMMPKECMSFKQEAEEVRRDVTVISIQVPQALSLKKKELRSETNGDQASLHGSKKSTSAKNRTSRLHWLAERQ